jgi:hypothetical protein
MSILKMSSNTEIREKGECAAVRAVGQGLWGSSIAPESWNFRYENTIATKQIETTVSSSDASFPHSFL